MVSSLCHNRLSVKLCGRKCLAPAIGMPIMNSIPMLKKYFFPLLLISLVITVNAIRFINIEMVPNGFQVDEQIETVALGCLAQDGSDPLGNGHYPLFGYNSFATPTPPTYMYPGVIWVKLFGFDLPSLRSFSAFLVLIALLGLFMAGRHIGGTRMGLWVLLAGSISPWIWTISRVAWDSLSFLPYFTWGLFFCLAGQRLWQFIMAGILLSAAAYSYPPARLMIPVFLILMSFYGFGQLKWTLSRFSAGAIAFIVASLPLAYCYMIDPSLSARFRELSIVNPEFLRNIPNTGWLPPVLAAALKNFLLHLHPDFLLFKGSPLNRTLSTGHQGVMSWLDVAAFTAGLAWIAARWKTSQRFPTKQTLFFFGFLAAGILIGILPAALVATDNPHTLRAVGAWPFAMLATGFILHKATDGRPWRQWAALATAVIFMAVFLKQYFEVYPKESAGWFSAWSIEEARNAKTDEDWMKFLYRYRGTMFLSRYALMRYHGQSCGEARGTWSKLYHIFEKIHAQNDPKNP